MVINQLEKLFVTSDAATVIKELEVSDIYVIYTTKFHIISRENSHMNIHPSINALALLLHLF